MILARREILRRGLGLAAGSALIGPRALAYGVQTPTRRLGFHNLHTDERLDVAYWENGAYVPDALSAVNHVLRDHRNNEVHPIAPGLLDLLSSLARTLDTAASFQVISGYRSPASNAAMHAHSEQVASGSLHMQGEAIDIRISGRETANIRDAAMRLAGGGVGFYPVSDFVHVDVGRVRHWSGA